jgi:hypothetical protein
MHTRFVDEDLPHIRPLGLHCGGAQVNQRPLPYKLGLQKTQWHVFRSRGVRERRRVETGGGEVAIRNVDVCIHFTRLATFGSKASLHIPKSVTLQQIAQHW